MNAPWYSILDPTLRAEAKARDDAKLSEREQKRQSDEWVKVAHLDLSVSLYRKRISGSESQYSYRGTLSRCFHTWPHGSEAKKRCAWLLAQSPWPHLPARMTAHLHPVAFLELRRGRHRSLCLSDRATPSLYAAVDEIRASEEGQ
jgi:hypothetical protein